MEYYLGVDIGTTAAKAVAFAGDGTQLHTCSRGYAMHHPAPDRSEQNPDEIWEAVVYIIRQTVAALQPGLPLFISFSAAMHSLIAVDDKGSALTPVMIWADNRAAGLAEALKATGSGQHFYRLTGTPVHAMSQFSKLLWLKQNEPALFNGAGYFIGIKEYVFFRLSGTCIIDTSIASATGLLCTQTLQWAPEVLSYLGLSADRLPRLVPPEHRFICTDAAAALLQVPAGTPVVAGGNDGGLANLGAGATDPDLLTVTIGTSAAARLTVSQPQTDTAMRTFCYHIRGNQYVIGGAGNNGGVVLDWLKEKILASGKSYEALMQEAGAVPAGSDGLLFLPYLLGERAPLWDTSAKGVYFGLTISHTQAHLIRATLEGIILNMYYMAAVLLEQWPVEALLATGGFAQNAVWLQLLADVFGKEVRVGDTIESSATGAVVIGAGALGLPFTSRLNVTAVYRPDAAAHAVYKASHTKFKRLYELLKDEMKEPDGGVSQLAV